jgi:phage shock protein A
MQRQDSDNQLNDELKAITAALKQIQDDLAVVKTEVHTIHSQVTELPTGRQFGESAA